MEPEIEEIVEGLKEAAAYRGWALMDVLTYRERNQEIIRVFVDVHNNKSIVHEYENKEEARTAVRKVEDALKRDGYEVSWIWESRMIVEAPEKPRLFVLFLGFAGEVPDELKERFKPRLMTIESAKNAGFRFVTSVLDTWMFYGNYACRRVFFTHGKRGWFNLTYNRPETPGNMLREHLKGS